MINLSLGRDHKARKALPILRVLGYFTAAIAGLARHAVRGNDQHNPGERLHWARGKSMDHDECIVRHSLDVLDYQAWLERNPAHPDREQVLTELEHEYDARLWRAAADAQTFYEQFRGAPISPSSKLPVPAVPEGTVAPPIVDVPAEAVVQMPGEGEPRCGHMSRTRRVCTRLDGHGGQHADHVAHWPAEDGEARSPAG